MKVYIGPYKSWLGPYQISDRIPFISEDTADKIGNWLSNSWLQTACDWINDKRDRTIKVRIDNYDTWSMDNTLAHIILPMLKQLKETKHGSPLVDDEDVPTRLRHGNPNKDDNWVHYKWDYVLDEIIWAFEQELDDSWEDQFHHGESNIEWVNIPGTEFSELRQKNKDYWIDGDGISKYNKRIDNGFRLFGKYYRGLWE